MIHRNTKFFLGVCGAAIALSAVAVMAVRAQPPAPAPAPPAPPYQAYTTFIQLVGPGGRTYGFARVQQTPPPLATGRLPGVVLHIEATGLPAGWHGMHFHNKADCSAADLTSSGPHISMTNPVVHGFFSSNANDFGDLPNIFVGADGKATVEVFSPFVLVAATPGDGRPILMDQDGSALIIHANRDDYNAQPIGGAGARIACGAISAADAVAAIAAANKAAASPAPAPAPATPPRPR